MPTSRYNLRRQSLPSPASASSVQSQAPAIEDGPTTSVQSQPSSSTSLTQDTSVFSMDMMVGPFSLDSYHGAEAPALSPSYQEFEDQVPKAKKVKFDEIVAQRIRVGYRYLSYGSDMATTVQVHVGVEGKLFILHQPSLCDVSPFFKRTFLGNSKEAREKRLNLPVTDPGTFKAFVEWLYSRKLLLDRMDDEVAKVSRLPNLADIYVFADNYDIPQLERDTMDAVISYIQKDYPLPGLETVKHVFESLQTDSPLCKLLVNEYARTGQQLSGGPDRWPAQFVFEAFNASSRAKALGIPIQKPDHDCKYHNHSSQSERKACLDR